jgi:hypothetical protein
MSDEPEESMRVSLIAAPTDSPLNSPEYQKELAQFFAALRAEGMRANPRLQTRDAIGADAKFVGEFVIVTAVAGSKLIKIITKWLKRKPGRNVRLKTKDIDAQAGTTPEVERLFKLAQKTLKSKRKRKR